MSDDGRGEDDMRGDGEEDGGAEEEEAEEGCDNEDRDVSEVMR